MKLRWIALALVAATAPAAYAQADQGNFIVRARAVHLDSADKDSTGLGLTINNKTIPEVDITYFFSPNLAAELILTYPQKQKVYSNGSQIGTFKHLPPTLSLQYHFNPDGRVRPYAGVGVNYTRFSGERPATLELDNSVGPAAQLGVDFGLNDKWFLNVSARYIDIDTDAKLGGTKLGKVEVDPFVYGLHVGYKFGKPAAPAPAPVAAPVEPPPPPPPPADTDGDGVIDSRDACPGTPAGTRVDARGCELDSDGDGVVDSKDRCPNTPAGSKVDEYGCSLAARLEVHFDTASAVLKPESYADLDAVAKFMTDVPRVAGVLEGHTDSVGNDKSNERLSQRRAESVKAYLVSKGIDPARLQTQGFGESQPEADNATADGRAKNRRVVLRRTDTQ